jgi:hypothetical protein
VEKSGRAFELRHLADYLAAADLTWTQRWSATVRHLRPPKKERAGGKGTRKGPDVLVSIIRRREKRKVRDQRPCDPRKGTHNHHKVLCTLDRVQNTVEGAKEKAVVRFRRTNVEVKVALE